MPWKIEGWIYLFVILISLVDYTQREYLTQTLHFNVDPMFLCISKLLVLLTNLARFGHFMQAST